MKFTKPILAATACAVLLAGCASPNSDDQAAVAESTAPSTEAAGSEDTSSPTPSTTKDTQSPTPSASQSPSATPSPLPTTTDELNDMVGSASPTYSERGGVPKEIGVPGAKGEENGIIFMSFRVTDIDGEVTCQPGNKGPENGRFVAVSMDFQTSQAMADAGWDGFTPYDWEFLHEDGTMFNAPVFTEASQACLPTAETLPDTIGPLRKASGKVVLDLTDEPGFIIFGRSEIDNNGWEYKLPK